MKKLLIACALSCATITTTAACIPNLQEQVVIRGTQALIVAEYAYNSVGTIALAGLRDGTIKGNDAARVQELNRQATALLIKGKTAQSDADRATAATALLAIVAELRSISGGNNGL